MEKLHQDIDALQKIAKRVLEKRENQRSMLEKRKTRQINVPSQETSRSPEHIINRRRAIWSS